MSIIEDTDVAVVDVGFPPPPSPDIVIDFQKALDMLGGLRAHARHIEHTTHLFPQQVAFFKGCADVLQAAFEQAGWELSRDEVPRG